MMEITQQIADLIAAHSISTKEVLTSEEAAKYMGISISHLYRLTMDKTIPYYKPMGKMCYFNRIELEQWLQRKRVNSKEEAEQQAIAYCMKKGGRRR